MTQKNDFLYILFFKLSLYFEYLKYWRREKHKINCYFYLRTPLYTPPKLIFALHDALGGCPI